MNLPVPVKSLAVSNEVSPVTHTALVAVNMASTKLIGLVVEFGSRSSSAPTNMMMKKLAMKMNDVFLLR